ncbi:MAG: DUF1788 domain-containing protein [Chloroflexia bacterium]|nr:DUF1788 domain-containing protein [Chloroflexia bacterium]
MSTIEGLIKAYGQYVAIPWDPNLAGPQRVWFVVYEPAHERRLRMRIGEFETRTLAAGHGWQHVDLTHEFSRWMASHEYRDAYFEHPEDMEFALVDFEEHLAARVVKTLHSADEHAVVALSGLASLFDLTKVSTLIEAVAPQVRGRLVAFFPGQYENTTYRLLDARDGWNYLAVPIRAMEEH